MIQRIISEESARHIRGNGDQRRAAFISMQRESGTLRLWCRLEAAEVIEIARIVLGPFATEPAVIGQPYLAELTPVGPSADMKEWSGDWEPVSTHTRWYVEVIHPKT